MEEVQVEVSGHDDSVTRVLVVQGCLLLAWFVRILDRQNGAAAVGKGSYGIVGVISS